MDRRTFLVSTGSTTLAATAGVLQNCSPSPQAPTPSPSVLDGTATMKMQKLSWAGIKIEVGKTTVLIEALQLFALILAGDIATERGEFYRDFFLGHWIARIAFGNIDARGV